MANIISFTSFGRRLYESAARAALTMLDQTIPADRVILWAQGDYPDILDNLPGLEIHRVSEDYGSHNKWFWALKEFPNDNLILADDDCYYPYNWLENILSLHAVDPTKIVLNRFSCVSEYVSELFDRSKWKRSNKDTDVRGDTSRCVALHAGGALYPPNSLYQDVSDTSLFQSIARNNDDIWLWAMALLQRKDPFLLASKEMHKNCRIAEQDPTGQNLAGGTSLCRTNFGGGVSSKVMREIVSRYPILLERLSTAIKREDIKSVVVHLSHRTDREPHIDRLKELLPDLEVIEAISPETNPILPPHQKLHPKKGQSR